MPSNSLYYLLQFFVFCLMSLIGVLSAVTVFPGALKDVGGLLNTFIYSLKFILLTHFVIRFGFKQLSSKLPKKSYQVGLILALALSASFLHALVKLPKFGSEFERDKLALSVETNTGSKVIEEDNAVAMQVGSYFVFFALWGVSYLVVTGRRKEQEMYQLLQKQQLENLMAQLNPHFLFNSMNTIRALIYEDKDKAAEMVTQLSELFRYNLSSGGKSAVTLKEELEVCLRYLDIEKSRLGDRIQIEIQVSSDLSQVKLPGMSLFTLVENAVKHGVATIPGGGTIQIAAQKIQQQCRLSVSNPYQEGEKMDGTRIGLDNLTKRLELMFGRQATLNIKQSPNEYTAEVMVPYEA